MRIKDAGHSILSFFRNNPHFGPALLLLLLGAIFLTTIKFAIVSGALFGAGASLLGAWISDFNSRKKEIASKEQKEKDAEQYLAPELLRTITRLLYIQNRAIVNYSVNFNNRLKNGKLNQPVSLSTYDVEELGDQKEDFLPCLPLLYPNATQFKDLNGSKAIKLVVYYDSLYELQILVNDWWNRKGQLPSNIFGHICHTAEKSLTLALECLTEFQITQSNYDSLHAGTLADRIKAALDQANQTRSHCYDNFEKAQEDWTKQPLKKDKFKPSL